MIDNLKWEPRESNVFHKDVLEMMIFDGLPRDRTWDICNKILYDGKTYKIYMRFMSGEDQPRIYTKTGDYQYINDAWNDVKDAIVLNKTSKYVM